MVSESSQHSCPEVSGKAESILRAVLMRQVSTAVTQMLTRLLQLIIHLRTAFTADEYT